MSVTFFVKGKPVQQGSKNAFVAQKAGGKPRAVMFDENPESLKAWRVVVQQAAMATGFRLGVDSPARVDLVFYVARPDSAKRRYPHVRPDLDKYTRAVFDALTKSKIVHDDSRIVTSTQKKRYADDRPIGVLIRVSEEKEI